MPLTTEIKTPQGASMVQRGIDSFFKSPSRPTEEKKGLLNYFQKQSPEVEKQNSLTGTNTDKLSAVNESSKNNSPDKKNDNVKCNIFESSSKFNGKTSEVKPLKSKLKRSKKGDLDSQNDKPSLDIENKNHKSLNEEKAKSKLKLTKKSDSKKKNNHHDISQEDETSQLILKDVTNESKSKVKNKDNDSIVVKEVDMIEVSVEETNLRNASPVKTPENKSSSKIKEMEKKDSDSLLKANPKTGNAFAFMMANRHKQDEVIKEIEEKEEENSKAEVTSSAESEELALKSNRNHLLNADKDDSEDEQIFIKKSPKEEKIKKESKPSTNNAFSFLMSNRFNSPVEKRTKKVDESDNSNSDNLKIDEEEIKQSKKRKQTAANSISCDSDADDVLETNRKKIPVKKQNEVEKNKDQKKISKNHNTPVNNNILVTKNEGSNIDVTEVITKVNEEDDTSQNTKFCKKSDSLQTISFASFMNETTEDDKDKMEKVNIKDDLLKKTQKESDSCQTISFASFMKESSEGDKEKLERVNGKDDSLKKNVRFDNSDNEEDKCYSLKSDKRSKKFDPDPDDDDDEWDIDSENETKRHETKKKKMKMSFGMFRKKSKSENKSDNIDIKKNDDVKMSDSQNEDLTSHISPLSEITPEKKNEKVSINEKKADEIENNTEEIMDREPKKKGISNFFKKMTKDEQLEARNKNIVTIKVDVHATNDGKEEECVGKNVRRSTRRQPKQKEEPVELDKIELLEQVDVSPMKYYKKEKIRTLNDTLEHNSTSKTTIKEIDGNHLVRDKQVKVTDKQKPSHLEEESSEEVTVDIILSKSQNKDEKENDINKDVKEIPLRPKRTSAKFSLNFDIEDDNSTNGKSEERPLRSRRSVSTTPEVDVGDRKSKRLKTKLQSPAASSADQDNDPENEDPVVAATSGRRIASSVSSSGSVNSPVKYTATLDSTPGKLSLKLKKVSKLSKKLNKESPDLGSQKKLLLSRGKKKIMTPAEMKALLQEVQGDAEDDQDTDDTSADKSLKRSKKKLILKRSSKSPLKNKKTRQMLLTSPGLSPKVKALAKGKKKLLKGSARHQEAVAAKEKRNKNTEGEEETDSDVKESNARRSSRQAVVNAKNIVEISSEDESKCEEQQEKKRTKRCSKEKDQSEVKNKVNCLTQTPIKKEVILVATPRGKNLRKTTWCGKCAGCKTPNCQKCTHCKNMPKYGGPGTLKKPCKKRKCFNPNVSVKAAISGNKEIKSSKGLASIFMKKKDVDIEVLEVVLSPSKLKARQDFLQSGVPETIKKKVLIEKRLEEEFNDAAVFPSVSHVQQVETDHWVWNLTHQKVKNLICESTVLDDLAAQSKSLFMSPLSEAEVTEDILPQQPELMDSKTLCSILCGIKKRNANFPVFAVFKSYLDQKKEGVESYKKELEKEMKSKTVDIVDLMSPDKDEEIGNGKRKRRSKGSPVSKKQKLSRSKGKRNSIDFSSENTDTVPIWQKWTPNAWTQMFAPNHSSQVIGNADILRKMKVWLLEWKKQTESDAFKQKSSKKKARREDDFLTSDESCGWEDDNELANTLLLAGPPGVGKTAAVYALAQELGYKVLEVNASSQRKGAQVMKQLAEATQSHSMSGGNSSQGTPGGTPSKNPLTAMFGSKQKKKTKEKVIVQEDSSSVDKEKKMAMVLFEDIDIVFDEYDDGFIMAVNNIMAETKRPIILTTTYLTPNVLAKIKGNFEYLTFQTPANELVCQHLELMALSGGVAACREDLCWLIEHCRGDIRQAISTLQSWILTGSSHTMCVNGLEYKQMSNGNNTEEWICNVKEITLKEVFPDTKETLLREVHVHRGSLFGYLSRNTGCNSNAMTSVYKLPWTKIFINLPHLLPFHLVENVVEKKQYPLNPESAEVKKSVLYQKQNWLSFDDESDDDEKLKSEGQEQVSNNTDKIKEIKTDAPPDVIKSSKLCLQSISTLSSTLCDLDIFNSVPEMGNLMSHESGFEWRSWQPTPGLSDGYCTHQDWASQNFVTDLNNYISCSAADHCSMQVKDALVITSTPDHPQLCVSLEKTNIKSQTLISRAPQIDRTIKQLEQISSILPTTVQQNKAILGCDYFPALRQIVRFDELGAALSHKRRGRRFLSYMSGLGFHLDPSEKINMANTLLD